MSQSLHADSPHLVAGIAGVALSGCLLAGMDAVGKQLMQSVDPVPVIWGRYFFHTVIVLLVLSLQGKRDFLKPRAPGIQNLRGVALLGVTVFMYFAIQKIPLADASAVMFFAPVLLTLLAGPVLGEHVRSSHLIAVVLGFAGVLMVVQPGFRELQVHHVLPLGSAISLALYMALTRKLKHLDDEATTQFQSTVVGAVVMSLLLPLWWQPLDLAHWLLMLCAGALGAAGHFVLIKAFHLAPASSLSPFTYIHLLAATIYSVAWFGDALTPGFAVGAVLIVGAGILVWHLDQAPKTPGSAD